MDTPLKNDEIENVNLNDLEMTFSGLKIKDVNSKDTVEGSPLLLKLSSKYLSSYIERSSIQVIDSNENIDSSPVSSKICLNPTPSRNDIIAYNSYGLTNNINVLNDNKTNTKKVYVLSAGSDEHDTGNHQENARRTELLCGKYGCLRRSALQDHIEWGNSDNVKLAPLADILRVHDFAYFQHLQQKCKDSNDSNMPWFYAPQNYLDADTPLVHQSLDASRKFCGAAMMAVDKIMSGSYQLYYC